MSGQIEDWRPVVGFEGLYEVSNRGGVRSLDRVLLRGRHPIALKGRMLLGTVSVRGYSVVSLRQPGQSQQKRYVHQLVAIAFLVREPQHTEVNHLDGDKQNNTVANLEWCTREENMAHAWETGLVPRERRAAA